MALSACLPAQLPRPADPHPDPPASALPPRRSDFIWGINGHPTQQRVYSHPEDLDHQLSLIDSLGATFYRIDLSVDSAGNTGQFPTRPSVTFDDVLDAADREGIQVLPVITSPRPDYAITPDANERIGYLAGRSFASRYGSRLTHIETGNELDEGALKFTGTDYWPGSDTTHFDPTRLRIVTAFLRGMTRGIREAAPQIRIIIDAQDSHYGFFPALHQAGVALDVYGYHWYSSMHHGTGDFGSVVQALSALPGPDLPIWVTEISRRNGSHIAPGEDPGRGQGYWIERFARELYRYPRVQALFVYELYDEQVFGDREGHYGLVSKPAFESYGRGIEEQAFGYEDYVQSLYHHLNRSPLSDHQLVAAAAKSRRARSKPDLLAAFDLATSRQLFVRRMLTQLLDDPEPRPEEVARWVTRMGRGLSRRDLIIRLCAGKRFWELSGRSDAGYMARLDDRLLQGPRIDGGRSRVRDKRHRSRAELAARVVDGPEYRSRFVEDQYRQLLDLSPPPRMERLYWVGLMQQGLSEEDVIRELLYSSRFWNAAVRDGYDRRHRRSRSLD